MRVIPGIVSFIVKKISPSIHLTGIYLYVVYEFKYSDRHIMCPYIIEKTCLDIKLQKEEG